MQYILNGVKPHHFFLQNICLKGSIPLLRNDVCCVLMFHSYGRAYSHVSSPNGDYLYIHVVYFRTDFLKSILLHIFFNQLIHNCVKVHRKLCTYTDSSQATGLGIAQDISGNWYQKKVCGLAASFIHLPVCCKYSNFQPLTTVPSL